MDYLRIRNWDKFQHYKDRNPPWIKIYTSLLDDYEFLQLSWSEKGQLIFIWLLAARICEHGFLPNDLNFIRLRIGFVGKRTINEFISKGFLELVSKENHMLITKSASKALATRYQLARPETEQRRDRAEKRGRSSLSFEQKAEIAKLQAEILRKSSAP